MATVRAGIRLWWGEGARVGRRLLGEVVPLLVALTGGWILGARLGLLGGLVGGTALWIAVTWAVAWVRRRPRLRRLYHLALVAHVLFWSVRGAGGSVPRPAGPIEPVATVAWAEPGAFVAGGGRADFVLPDRATLAGWGARPRRQRLPAFGGIGAPGRLSLALLEAPTDGDTPRAPLFVRPQERGERLGARALWLRAEGGGPALAIVSLDLIVMEPTLREAVLARVAGLGLEPATLWLAANHTHSGPGGFQRSRVAAVAGTDHFDADVFDAIAEAAAEALRRAAAAARPARIAFPTARDRGADGAPVLSRARRGDDPGAIDDLVSGIRLEAKESGQVLALLVHYAVHPLLLDRHHLAFGPDLAGAVEEAISASLPEAPVVLFLQGATGDVSPRRTHGKGPEAARRLAGDFAEAVAADLAGGATFDRLRLRAAEVRRDLGDPYVLLSMGSRDAVARRVVPSAVGEDAPSVLANALVLPANVALWSLGLDQVRVGFSFEGGAGVVLDLAPQTATRTASFGALVLEVSGGSGPGPLADRRIFVWSGGLPTRAAGRGACAALASVGGDQAPLVFSLVNGALGYVTTDDEYLRGAYEGISTLHGPDTGRLWCEALVEAAERAADGE